LLAAHTQFKRSGSLGYRAGGKSRRAACARAIEGGTLQKPALEPTVSARGRPGFTNLGAAATAVMGSQQKELYT